MTIFIPANGWQPRPSQKKLWMYLQNGGKRAIEIAHRRWGKDEVGMNWAAAAAHERIGNYAHCLPEFAQARRAIWTAVNPHTGKRRIDEVFPPAIRETTNEQEMFIRFKSGSTWQVIGSDQYDRLVGSSLAGIVFSEWALADPAAWAYLAPILVENKGWALFITTSRGRNHAKTMLDMARTTEGWFAEVSTVEQTGLISKDDVEAQRREYRAIYGEEAGDALIEQEFLCSFVAALLGSFYGGAMNRADNDGRIADFEVEDRWPVYTAIDIGKGNHMAVWFFQIAPPWILVIDYWQGVNPEAGAPQYVEMLKGKPYRYAKHFVPHDAAPMEWGTERTRIETLIELGVKPERVPNHRVEDGINAVQQILPKCKFHATNCAVGIEALRQYQREWDEKHRVFKDAPLHNWASHPADGFRYVAMAYREEVPEAVRPMPRMLVVGPSSDVSLDDLWDDQSERQRRRMHARI
jgi:hypothetical protein